MICCKNCRHYKQYSNKDKKTKTGFCRVDLYSNKPCIKNDKDKCTHFRPSYKYAEKLVLKAIKKSKKGLLPRDINLEKMGIRPHDVSTAAIILVNEGYIMMDEEWKMYIAPEGYQSPSWP